MKLPWAAPLSLKIECWCGAPAGEECRGRDGERVTTHLTRGRHDRLTMDALMRSAGLQPLLDPAERKLLERRARSRGR